jgi:hypothetical protein
MLSALQQQMRILIAFQLTLNATSRQRWLASVPEAELRVWEYLLKVQGLSLLQILVQILSKVQPWHETRCIYAGKDRVW